MDIFANICGGRVSEDVQYPERSELAAGAATPPLRAHHLEEHMRRLEGHTKGHSSQETVAYAREAERLLCFGSFSFGSG